MAEVSILGMTVILLALIPNSSGARLEVSADVIIYDSTPSGIMAAVAG